jgi:hypothetical protein
LSPATRRYLRGKPEKDRIKLILRICKGKIGADGENMKHRKEAFLAYLRNPGERK